MTTTIEYVLLRKSEHIWYTIGRPHATEEQARNYAFGIRDDEDETYRIIKRETQITETVESQFTVPVYVPTPEEFAEDAAAYADGSRGIDWTGIERYSEAEQERIREHVHELVDTCEHCGYYHSVHSLSDTEYGVVCDSCEQECAEQEEEEDEG